MKKLKDDTFRVNRGGYSRILEVSCDHCTGIICYYQKDGPGILKRMYLDRIIAPKKLVGLEKIPLAKIPNLLCPQCKKLVAIPYTYPKEKRLAYRLFEGELKKRIVSYSKVDL